MIDNQVISKLQGPEGNGYVPVGPDLRYIGKLPGTNNNNFEEEYILGEDKQITRSYTVDGKGVPCYKEVIEYRNKNILYNYYELEYFEYDMRPQRQDITVDGDKMTINLHSRLENFPAETGVVLRKYNLQWHPQNGGRELISVKTIKSKYEQNDKYFVETITRAGG